jgi:hypothetical protein
LDFLGEFETHLTVRVDDPIDLDALRTWAALHRIKFTHIVLDRGQTPSQPMVTFWGKGRLAEQRTAADALRHRLTAAGFAVARAKVEAAVTNPAVPRTDADATAFHTGRYFEHHVKLSLDDTTDLGSLGAVARQHDAHLSRNARRATDGGRHERFVTQRCRGVGRPTARRRLDALLAALRDHGHRVVDVEEEFVVHDDNLAVDAGWLDGEAGLNEREVTS